MEGNAADRNRMLLHVSVGLNKCHYEKMERRQHMPVVWKQYSERCQVLWVPSVKTPKTDNPSCPELTCRL